ncbi:MAG TPA: TcpQ domain-containing protein [Gammaproteobacteria bacterium]|nr:TcpQ domain-containing protein [Gammaproteobacteria bacterium]
MKCLAIRTSFFLLILFPLISFAGWQVAKPGAAIPNEPFFQAGTQQNTAFIPSNGSNAFPNRFAHLGRPAPVYAISLSGSLKENLERIMDRYHWRVVWKVPYDYNFDGRVTGSSLPDVIEKILQPFPLQARMYMSNRTMTVVQRKP